jgi:tRNA(Ile)-lysidine synthase
VFVSDSPLEPLSREPALLLAVSGGPDSTALLLMAAAWAAEQGSPELFAATVDHGLRAESAAEAERVAALAARLGVAHATLVWEGEKPSARLQERAREARYALLAAHARTVGAGVVVTAHHLDDQAETVLMRLTRGSGVAGLAGMAARSRRGEIDIARPLLTIPKAELVAFCEARGVDYARDPSNADPRFARPRLRAIAESLAAEGLDVPALARLARRAATVEAAIVAKTAEAERRLRLVESGRCDASVLAGEPIEIVRRLLTLAAAKASGADAARVPLDAMERIAEEVLRAASGGGRYAANVAGAMIVCDLGSEVRVSPEPPRRTGDLVAKQT